MGRKRMIDRDLVLDAAEELTREQGAARLTLDAVAKRAGISKGGLMYSFASKDALITAITERDIDRFAALLAAKAKSFADEDHALLRARIAATAEENPASSAKGASLLAALAQTPEHLAKFRDAYSAEMASYDPESAAGRKARLAMIAIEGAFLLRGLGLMTLTEAEWSDIFADISRLLLESDGPRPKAPNDY